MLKMNYLGKVKFRNRLSRIKIKCNRQEVSEKSKGQTQTDEKIVESENGGKAVFLEGGVTPGGNGVEHAVVPMKVEEDEHMESDEAKGVDLSESMEAKEIVTEVQHEEQAAVVESPEREGFEE